MAKPQIKKVKKTQKVLLIIFLTMTASCALILMLSLASNLLFFRKDNALQSGKAAIPGFYSEM